MYFNMADHPYYSTPGNNEDDDFEVHVVTPNGGEREVIDHAGDDINYVDDEINYEDDNTFDVHTGPSSQRNNEDADEDIVYEDDDDIVYEDDNTFDVHTDPSSQRHNEDADIVYEDDDDVVYEDDDDIVYEDDDDIVYEDDNTFDVKTGSALQKHNTFKDDIVYYIAPDTHEEHRRTSKGTREYPFNTASMPRSSPTTNQDKVFVSKQYPDIAPQFTGRDIREDHHIDYADPRDQLMGRVERPKRVGTYTPQNCKGSGERHVDSNYIDNLPSTAVFMREGAFNDLPVHGHGKGLAHYGRVGSIDVEVDESDDEVYVEESPYADITPNINRDPQETGHYGESQLANLSDQEIPLKGLVSHMFAVQKTPTYVKLLAELKRLYETSLIKICNKFLPQQLKTSNLKKDFRDGIRIHSILTELCADVEDLPYPRPKTYEQKVANNEIWSGAYEGEAPKLEEGDLENIFDVLTTIFTQCYIERAVYKDLVGWPALQFFFTRYNISFTSTDFERLIDYPDNLREIIDREFPSIGAELAKLDRTDSQEFEVLEQEEEDLDPPEEIVPPRTNMPHVTKSQEDEMNEELKDEMLFGMSEELQQYLKVFDVHFGIPQILHPQFDVLDEEFRTFTSPYSFLQCMYGAFILEKAIQESPKKANSQTTITSPKEYINYMLRKYMEIEKTGAELGEASVQYYNKLQEYINHLNKYLLMVSPDTESNKDILAKARSLISRCMKKRIENFSKITQLTAKLHSLAKIWNRETVVVVDQSHTLQNLEKCFHTLIALHRKIEQKVRGADSLKLQGYQRDFKKKINLIKFWITRWASTSADVGSARYNASILSMRHKLLEKFDKEAKHIACELEVVELLHNTLLKEDIVSQQDKCANEDDFRYISDSFKQLKDAIAAAKEQFKRYETEAREMDSLYLEKATLMHKIDVQLREFYEYFTYRPLLQSTKEFKMMSKQVQRAYSKLSEVALEIDAVLSISEIHKNSPGKLPTNFYTSYKDAHLTSHWENTLSCAIELEKWLAQQEKVAEQIDKQLNSKLEGELHFLALDMRDHVAAISKEESGQIMDERRLTNIKTRVERATTRLLRNREDKIHELFDIARPLHEKGIVTHKVIDMMECWDNCVLTLQILQDDVDHQLCLIKSENKTSNKSLEEIFWNRSSTLLKAMDGYYSVLGSRIIVPRSAVKLSEQGKAVIAPPLNSIDDSDFQYKSDIPEELLDFSDQVDPYGRVSCTMWLDVLYKLSDSVRDSTLLLRKAELEEQFKLLSDGKPYITEQVLREILGSRDDLMTFALKHSSEYFGFETQELAKNGITCYDYSRFVCSILGLHRKLSVNPN